ncbi:MAG: AMP-binding protein [Ilumatobacter sp.]|uniref:AMP-binding protein n=1 Tax=Ilumatobacter sp. TaxID=1967498 RepID=UPI0032974269
MPRFSTQRAAEDPTGFALVDVSPDGSREMTWAEVDEALNRCASRLLAAGAAGELGPDHRIAVFAENAAETALAHLGGLLAGASSVPVNFHLTADEAEYIFTDSGSGIVFVGPETAERGLAAARAAGIDTVVGWGCDDVEGVTPWTDWLAAGSNEDPPDAIVPRPNLLYTSGTTGQPKGTELPPTMFAGGGDMVEHLEALATGGFAGFGTHLVVGPMYHTGPLSGMRLLCAGVASVILTKFDAETTIAAIDRYRTESTVMVPTHFVRMLALPADVKSKYDVSSMKMIAHTGAKCPVDVKAAMIEWFGPVFRDAYGATEVGTVCSISSEEWMEHRGSVGRAVAPFTAVVFDDDMNEVAPNVEGRLFFRDDTGRGIVYPNDAEKTAASNPEPGLFTLGEIGFMDDDGFVYITDRFSDMVVSGGANLYPAEAEQILIDHPGVADVGCVGVPHPDMGEMLIGLVTPADPASPPDPAELSTWLRDRLSHYKCPREFHVVDDLLRNTMGKINKRKLRDAWLAGELTTTLEQTH